MLPLLGNVGAKSNLRYAEQTLIGMCVWGSYGLFDLSLGSFVFT